MTTPVEDRLRHALQARADAVSPGALPGAIGDLLPRAAAARRRVVRRRAALSFAAVVVAVAAGSIVIDDVERREPLETSDGSTVAPAFAEDAPAIWPLPSMSVAFDDPAESARTFVEQYLAVEARCDATRPQVGVAGVEVAESGATATVEVALCDGLAPGTQVALRRDGPRGWVVVGAVGQTVPVVTPVAGAQVPSRFDVEVATDDPDSVRLELRDLGSLESWDGADLIDGNRTFFEAFPSHPGPQVLVVTDGRSATVLVVRAGPAADPEFTLPLPAPDAPVLWPPGDAGFATAGLAATDFLGTFVGLPTACAGDLSNDDLAVVDCAGTEVQVRRDGSRGWVAVGAASRAFAADVVLDDAGGVRVDAPAGLTVEVRQRFSSEAVVAGTTPGALTVPPDASGQHVVVVTDGDSASVESVHLLGARAACGYDVDPSSLHGYPGGSNSLGGARSPEEIALQFASGVLGFPTPGVAGIDGSRVSVHAREPGGPLTTIGVIDAGRPHVLCAASDRGTIVSPAPGDEVGGTVTVTGEAAAFERLVRVRATTLTGETLAEATTSAGNGDVLEPYAATLDLPATASGPGLLIITDAEMPTWGTVIEVVLR